MIAIGWLHANANQEHYLHTIDTYGLLAANGKTFSRIVTSSGLLRFTDMMTRNFPVIALTSPCLLSKFMRSTSNYLAKVTNDPF